MDVTRCAIADYFASLGKRKLCQRAICDQDIRSATHHGIVLERSGTLSSGADRCDFRYHVPSAQPQVAPKAMLEDSVAVDAPPEEVWSWLADLAANYTDWHPDHVSAEWTRGIPNVVGSRLTVTERFDGLCERLEFEITNVEPPWRMEYRILGPHSLMLPGGAFSIANRDGGSVFSATIWCRFGRLSTAIFARRMTALRAHMREESQNLKELIETGQRHRRPRTQESRPRPYLTSTAASR